MFKNREFRIRVAKPEKDEGVSYGEDKILPTETVQLVAEKSKEVVKYIALAAVGVYAAMKAVDTISQIAVKKTKSAENE